MLCVMSIFATQYDRASNFRMPELSVRAFPAGRKEKPRVLQVRNQFANFARHMTEPTIRAQLCQS